MKKFISMFLIFATMITMSCFTSLVASAAEAESVQAIPTELVTLESEKYPGYFINTWAGTDKNGTKITLYRFDGTTDQWYRFEHLGNGEYYVRVYSSKKGSNRVWDIYWGNYNSQNARAGMPIDIWTPLTSEAKFQKFKIEIHEDGTVSFRVASNTDLAVAVNKGANGSQLVLKKYSSSDKSVKFRLCDTNGKRIDTKKYNNDSAAVIKPLKPTVSISGTSFKYEATINIKITSSSIYLPTSYTLYTDSGFNKKISINVSDWTKALVSKNINIPASELGAGEHQIKVVAENSAGQSSVTTVKITIQKPSVQTKIDMLLDGTTVLHYKSSTASAKLGTRWSDFKSSIWGYQCKGFATALYYELYNYNIASAYYGANRHVLALNNPSKTEVVFSTKRPSLTRLTELLKAAKPGDFCQISNAKIQHSLIVYSVDDKGITFVDANYHGDNVIRKHHMTWQQIYNYMGSSSYGISLYRNK